jgi:hypothetical protein
VSSAENTCEELPTYYVPPWEIRDSLSREDAALCYCHAGFQLGLCSRNMWRVVGTPMSSGLVGWFSPLTTNRSACVAVYD